VDEMIIPILKTNIFPLCLEQLVILLNVLRRSVKGIEKDKKTAMKPTLELPKRDLPPPGTRR
jgi:hypothetical protein